MRLRRTKGVEHAIVILLGQTGPVFRTATNTSCDWWLAASISRIRGHAVAFHDRARSP
jgi:hypothetical protein